jgi:hypothetical protein
VGSLLLKETHDVRIWDETLAHGDKPTAAAP